MSPKEPSHKELPTAQYPGTLGLRSTPRKKTPPRWNSHLSPHLESGAVGIAMETVGTLGWGLWNILFDSHPVFGLQSPQDCPQILPSPLAPVPTGGSQDILVPLSKATFFHVSRGRARSLWVSDYPRAHNDGPAFLSEPHSSCIRLGAGKQG